MKLIEKHIKRKLKDNSDLIDSQIIDSSLSYDEQKTEIEAYLNLMLSQEEKEEEELKNRSFKSLIDEQMSRTHKIKRQIKSYSNQYGKK